MSYASGFMMGTALVQGLGSMLMGGGAAAGMMGAGKMMSGASRMMGTGSSLFGSSGRGMMGCRGSKKSQGFEMPDIDLGKFLAQRKPREPFRLESDLPGRRRYRVAVISAEFAKLLEEKLGKLDYIVSIKVNAESGSILLTFAESDAEKIDNLAKWLSEKIFTYKTQEPAAGQNNVQGNMMEAQAGSI